MFYETDYKGSLKYYEGQWVNGEHQGFGRLFNANKELAFEGEF